MSGIVVFTSIVGDGYSLPRVEPHLDEEFVCFTDQQHLDGNGWKIRRIAPFFPEDPVRSSREVKMRPHRYLPGFTRSIYMDPSVQPMADIAELWDFLTEGDESASFALLRHSFRATLEEEFAACAEQGLEDPDVLHEHLETIRRHEPERLGEQPLWGGLIARRHQEPDVIEVMERWFALTCRYARRDQLSILSAIAAVPRLRARFRASDNHRSHVHEWPVTGYSRPNRYAKSVQERFPLGRAQLLATRVAAEEFRSERDEALSDLEAVREERDTARQVLEELLAERDRLRGERDWFANELGRLRGRRAVRFALWFAARTAPTVRVLRSWRSVVKRPRVRRHGTRAHED